LTVFLMHVYSNVDCHSLFTSIHYGWLERGNHLFARRGAFIEPLWKFAHSHTRPILGHVVLGLTNRGELADAHQD